MNFSTISSLKILAFLLLVPTSYAYKPVVLLHGILSDAVSMSAIGEQIKLVSDDSLLSNLVEEMN